MKQLGQGAAFGAGFFLFPILGVPVLLVLGILLLTHLWYLGLLALCVAGGAIVGIVKQVTYKPTTLEIMESRIAATRLATHNLYHGYEKEAGCPYC